MAIKPILVPTDPVFLLNQNEVENPLAARPAGRPTRARTPDESEAVAYVSKDSLNKTDFASTGSGSYNGKRPLVASVSG